MSKLLDSRISEKHLFDLYLNQGASIEDLAVLYGVSTLTIDGYLRKYALKSIKGVRRLETRKDKREPGASRIYRSYRDRANKRGLLFELTEQQFYVLIKSDCHYCGIPPLVQGKGNSLAWNGIDRTDNSQGYTIENTRPCCWPCNQMKRTMSEQQFLTHVLRISKHQTRLEA